MESLPRTFGAALVLGMVSRRSSRPHSTIVVDAVLFGVIIGALLLQRAAARTGPRPRRVDVEGDPRGAADPARAARAAARSASASALLGAVGVALLVFVPLAMRRSQVNLLGVGLIFAMVMCSLVLLTGWAGQISLGQLAIVAFGAAVAWTLALQGKHFFVCRRRRRLAGAGVAVALGIPALRIKGPFLAVTTLAFAVTTGTYFLNDAEFFPWLVPSVQERLRARPVLFDKFDLESEHTYYYVVLLALAFVVASSGASAASRTGRVLVATRDNSRAAQSYGISPVRAQLTAFGLSGLHRRPRRRALLLPPAPALEHGPRPDRRTSSCSRSAWSAASARSPAPCSAPPT